MHCPDRLLAGAILALASTAAQAVITCASSGGSLSLGTYAGDTSTPTDSIGTLVVRCTRDAGPPSVTVTVGIGPSANGGSIANRQLRQASGSDLLSYNLYRDALRQNVWGETPGANTVSQTVTVPNKATVNIPFTIYGRIPGLQSVYAGAYGDSLLVTFTY